MDGGWGWKDNLRDFGSRRSGSVGLRQGVEVVVDVLLATKEGLEVDRRREAEYLQRCDDAIDRQIPKFLSL